ncbi:MAG: aspartate aminotransferase [Alteromonadaceae bacterium]|jgi:aspartate aminotransferase
MNERLQLMSESINVKLSDRIREMAEKGKVITRVQTGDPDFDTPAFICNAASKSMTEGNTHYCASNGQTKLRLAISEKLKLKNKFTPKSSQDILVTHGAVHGVYLALQAIINPGDEVVLISPYWMPYHSCVTLTGGTPVIVTTTISNGFNIEIEKLTAAVTNKTKAIIINSPNNPTGCVYSKKTLRLIGELSIKHDLYVISDEVYEDLLYQQKHYSIQSIFKDYNKIISIFSFSKSYAMTGWRIGYMHASEAIILQANKLSQYITTSINSFVQSGAIAALVDPKATIELSKMQNAFIQRRTMIIEMIQDTWLESSIFIPQGAFYLFIDISRFSLDSMSFVEKLIIDHQVAFTPGIAFGKENEGFIRMTFACDEKSIKKALTVLIGLT